MTIQQETLPEKESLEQKNHFRVFMVADKESANLNSLLTHSMNKENSVDFAGIVAVGGNIEEDFMALQSVLINGSEFDKNMFCDIQKKEEGTFSYSSMRFNIGFENFGGKVDSSEIGKQMEERRANKLNSYSYTVLPYEKSQFKEEGNREKYMDLLLKQILTEGPNLVFLSNFKLVLDKKIPETLEKHNVQLVNVHPSVLPLNKGWRTEKMALEGENHKANGYTFHRVVPALDSGPVLFSREIPATDFVMNMQNSGISDILNNNGDLNQIKLGNGITNSLEERSRKVIIDDQSMYSSEIFEILSQKYPEKIVKDSEAFKYENREGFEKTEEYKDSLEIDFEHWKKENKNLIYTEFKDWKSNHRIPYSRVLFDMGDGKGFQTMESILNAEEKTNIEIGEIHFEYKFDIPLLKEKKRDIPWIFTSLKDKGIDTFGRTKTEKLDHDDLVRCNIKTKHSNLMREWLEENNIENYEESNLSPSVIKKRVKSTIHNN